MTFVINKAGTDAFPTGGAGSAAKDLPFSFQSRTLAGDPNVVGPLTPQFAGEIVLDTTNHALWKATAATATSWVALTPPYTP